jgi:pantothenate kinase type III
MDFRDLTQKIFSTASPKMLKDWIRNLLQKIEENEINISKVEAENEALKNKIRRMQGLSTKPKFSKSKDKTSDLETEDDNDDDGKAKTSNKRKDAAKKNRKTKKDIHIDKKEKITVDREMLDESFIYKGTRKVIVQELLFQSNNIEFEIERYYSPEFGYLEAELPQKYRNGFLGPCLKTWILTVYYQGNLTIKKMRSILLGINIDISLREINRIINKEYSPLVDEYDEARKEAIKRANFQQIDDTGANLCFKNAFTTVTCNPYFTGLYTSLKKNRKNAVIALTGGKQKLLYKLNDHAIMTAYLANKSLRMQLTLENLKS